MWKFWGAPACPAGQKWLGEEWNIVVPLPCSSQAAWSSRPLEALTLLYFDLAHCVLCCHCWSSAGDFVCLPICLSTTDQLVSATLSKPLIWLPVVVVWEMHFKFIPTFDREGNFCEGMISLKQHALFLAVCFHSNRSHSQVQSSQSSCNIPRLSVKSIVFLTPRCILVQEVRSACLMYWQSPWRFGFTDFFPSVSSSGRGGHADI